MRKPNSEAGFGRRIRMTNADAEFGDRIRRQNSETSFGGRIRLPNSEDDFECRVRMENSDAELGGRIRRHNSEAEFLTIVVSQSVVGMSFWISFKCALELRTSPPVVQVTPRTSSGESMHLPVPFRSVPINANPCLGEFTNCGSDLICFLMPFNMHPGYKLTDSWFDFKRCFA
jgi:hypothetical protein